MNEIELTYWYGGYCIVPLSEGMTHEALEQKFADGDVWAGLTLACGYSCGWFGHPDQTAAVLIYWQLVKRMLPEAVNNYAYHLIYGLGVRKDISRGMRWLKTAAELGEVCAMEHLAKLYAFGVEVERHNGYAKRYAQMAVENGSVEGYNIIGYLYEKGLGCRQSLRTARKHYDRGYWRSHGIYY